jgi:AcrR family transcriptional regulator
MSRRQQILGAAVELFQRYGVRKTTVDEIARAAGIGKGSVYLEFQGKEDIFLALVEEHERGILDEVRHAAGASAPIVDRLVEVALVRPRHNVREMELMPEIFEILASLRGRVADRVSSYHDRCRCVVADLIREGIGAGILKADDDPDEAARLYYRVFDVSFVFAMHGMPPAQIEDTLRRTARLFIRGLAAAGEEDA